MTTNPIKLKFYRPEDLSEVPVGKAFLTVSTSGTFNPSKFMKMAIGIKPGDKCLLVQNENAPKEWFFTLNESGFEFRQKSKNETALCFTSRSMMRVLYKALDLEVATRAFLVSKEPLTIEDKLYYPIITSSVK